MNYRDEAPNYLKEITSDGVISFFEDERSTQEDIDWFKGIVTSPDYQLKQNPISKYNWGKIKTAFVTKYFPELKPKEKKNLVSTESRLKNLLHL